MSVDLGTRIRCTFSGRILSIYVINKVHFRPTFFLYTHDSLTTTSNEGASLPRFFRENLIPRGNVSSAMHSNMSNVLTNND